MKTFSAIMKLFILTAALILTSVQSLAEEITVVDVKRNITLSDDDAVYKDFYLNAGKGSGLKKGLVVEVKRTVHVRDFNSKNVGDFETVVGQLKIIVVGDKVSVAREYKLTSREDEAMLDQIGVMSGDRIELANSFMDTGKSKKSASTETENAASEVAAAPSLTPAQLAPTVTAAPTPSVTSTTEPQPVKTADAQTTINQQNRPAVAPPREPATGDKKQTEQTHLAVPHL